MKSTKRISIVLAALLGYTAAFGQSGDFQTKGRVLAGGQPLAKASITYLNVGKRLSWDFSLADGTFGNTVSAMNPLPQQPTMTLPANAQVTIDIFGMNGELVNTVSGMLDKGTYTLLPRSAKLSQAMYMLRIKAGNIVMYRKLLNAGSKEAGYTISLSSKQEPLVMAKKLAYMDSIRVGKTGYAPQIIPITTYGDNVGDVTLTPIDIEGEVNTLFGQMTQAEILGQLAMPQTQNVGTLTGSKCGCLFGGGGALSGTNASGCADAIDAVQNGMLTTPRKIPILAAYDFVHGASAVPGATMFPHNLSMGAIQDTFLIQKAFRVTALEVRGAGCNWGFGPCIAVIRNDRWGRAYEGFCETPERTQIMSRHSVLGCQLTDLSNPLTYAACSKHFAGDGNTVNGTNMGTTEGPDSTARKINLPGYNAAVAENVATIMPSFSKWCDNVPMHTNKTLMTGWLKDTTKTGNPPSPGFKGFIVGDYDAHTIPSSIDAGLDVPMAASAGVGIITQFSNSYTTYKARYDDACKRVLRVKYWMNLFDPKQYLTDRRLTALVGCAEHRAVARACVRASMVLLKNSNNVLPLPKTASLAIWGLPGDNVGIQCGGWTVSWQGQSGAIPGGGATSIRAGIQAVDNAVTYVASPTAVGTSDYVLATLGETPYAETDFPDLSLTGNKTCSSNQNVITQIAAAHAAGKKVIGMLIAGRVLDISSIIDNCDAFIWAGLPGSEAGPGIADVLFGDYKFTGKLPVTWPTNSAQEPINYGDGKTGMFAYGYGLTD